MLQKSLLIALILWKVKTLFELSRQLISGQNGFTGLLLALFGAYTLHFAVLLFELKKLLTPVYILIAGVNLAFDIYRWKN